MISFIAIFLLFGGGAMLLGLVLVAIATKKLWIIPAAIVLALFAITGLGFLGAILVPTMHSNVTIQAPLPPGYNSPVGTVTQTVTPDAWNVSVNNGANGPPFFSGPNWSSGLLMLGLVVFLVVLGLRRVLSPGACHGARRAWPAVVGIMLIAFLVLGSVRTQYKIAQTSTVATEAARQTNEVIAAQQAITRQQFLANRPNAKIVSQVTVPTQIPSIDIHELMDQFDAPRIPVSPGVAKAPDAPAAPQAPAAPAPPVPVANVEGQAVASGDKSAATTNKLDAKKSAAASSNRRKKSDKAPAKTDVKQSQVATQAKPAEVPADKQEVAASIDKTIAIAKAESGKPNSRPSWVDETPKRTGGTRREVIITGPYATVDECFQASDVYLLLKTYQRMQQLAGQSYADGPLPSLTLRNGQIIGDGQLMSYGRGNPYWADERIRTLLRTGVGIDYVRREVVAKDSKNNEPREFIETVESSVGPMQKLYLQIEFTSAVDRELQRHWDAYQRRERFEIAGVGAGSVVGFLGLVFALLKIDTWTKGYYTKRLFIGVPAVIITVILLMIAA